MGKNGPIGGSLGMPAGHSAAPHWIPYVGVDDPHATVAQAKSMGGKVTKDVSSLPNGGSYAVLTDPQGAEFAIYKSATPTTAAPTGRRGFRLARARHHRRRGRDAFLHQAVRLGSRPEARHGSGVGLYHLFLHERQPVRRHLHVTER